MIIRLGFGLMMIDIIAGEQYTKRYIATLHNFIKMQWFAMQRLHIFIKMQRFNMQRLHIFIKMMTSSLLENPLILLC